MFCMHLEQTSRPSLFTGDNESLFELKEHLPEATTGCIDSCVSRRVLRPELSEVSMQPKTYCKLFLCRWSLCGYFYPDLLKREVEPEFWWVAPHRSGYQLSGIVVFFASSVTVRVGLDSRCLRLCILIYHIWAYGIRIICRLFGYPSMLCQQLADVPKLIVPCCFSGMFLGTLAWKLFFSIPLPKLLVPRTCHATMHERNLEYTYYIILYDMWYIYIYTYKCMHVCIHT